mgnify:CR=1 FL=1|tara:strand:+ start:9786 stop:11231 length:1446 start_codon:yes stop_codon:yes gene_type:complete
MAGFKVEELLLATGGHLLSGSKLGHPSRLSIDSRTVKPGEIFVAIKGRRFDGHAFVPSALKKGVRGVVVRGDYRPSFSKARRKSDQVVIGVDDPIRAFQDLAGFHRRRFDIPVVAVSGSNGKTTTTQMIGSILRQEFCLLQTKGNLNNHIGVPLTLLRLNRRHQMGVVEMGINQFDELTRLCGIAKPTIGVLTNIARTHLAGLNHLDGVARAKGELLASLPLDGSAILNADDPYFPFLRSLSNGSVVSFGFSPHADVHVTKVCLSQSQGWSFSLQRPGYRRPVAVRLPVPGRHNVANAAAASTVGFVVGVKATAIRNGLAKFRPMAMRTEIVQWNDVEILNDAYNANPTSMQVALEMLSHMPGRGRRIAVLGDMLELGCAAKAAHEEIGSLVAHLGVDNLILCGSMGSYTASGAIKAGMCRDHVVVTCDDQTTGYKTLIACLADCLSPGDTVLVKGSRSMRMEQVVEGWRKHFSRRRTQAR